MLVTKEQIAEARKMAIEAANCNANETIVLAGCILIANAILEIDQTAAAVAQKIVNYLP
jgi:hypothetical protein